MSEPHTLAKAGASDPLKTPGQVACAAGLLTPPGKDDFAKLSQGGRDMWDRVAAAVLEHAATASSAGPVPDEVRRLSEAVDMAQSAKAFVAWIDDQPPKPLAAGVTFRAGWAAALAFLATPSGRPDTPPAGGGAVDGPWSDLLEAARPFAGGVFHDNGDVTLDDRGSQFILEHLVRVIDACRDLEARSILSTPTEAEPAGGDYPPGIVTMLSADNRAMRAAGTHLAEAALRVIREYDGCHRLSLAVAEWSKTLGDEGGRGERHLAPPTPATSSTPAEGR